MVAFDPSPPTENFNITNTDITATRHEYWFEPPHIIKNFLLNQLKEARDAPIIFLIFNICITTVPAAIAMFLIPEPTHWMGLAYVILNCVLYLQRFILCLHYVEHLKPFKPTLYGWIFSQLCPYVLCMLYGIPSGIYYLHHNVMHHCENNLFPYDVSSTEPYQRDNFFHFIGYWMRFLFAISFELPYYAFRRGRYGLMIKAIFSLSFYFVMCAFLYIRNPIATLWVFYLPLCLASLAMMFGNWSQHIFINPKNPRSNYGLTYNLINASDNSKTFNDGYHIIHHINSKVHWTELPHKFMETLFKHKEEDALIFEGLGFFDLGVLVFSGNLNIIAKKHVDLCEKKRSEKEIVDLLKSRLRPIIHSKASMNDMLKEE